MNRFDVFSGRIVLIADGPYCAYDEVTKRDTHVAELEAAIDKLAQCKGRFHTEANFKALIEVRNKSLHK